MSLPWTRAIVVGASSGIGEEAARQLAAAGCRVALVARRQTELARLADEINAAHPGDSPRALTYVHDVRCGEEAPALFQQICRDLDGLDLILYAAGVMPAITPEEYSFEKDRLTVEVNVIGAVAWLNEAAVRFSRAGAGTIVGIASVAGDRGRKGYPVYGASKAALDHYLEALRNRLASAHVTVVTAKPGPVDTPMTRGRGKMPLMISASEAARRILAAAAWRKQVAYIPGTWRPIFFILRHIPSFLFKKMNI